MTPLQSLSNNNLQQEPKNDEKKQGEEEASAHRQTPIALEMSHWRKNLLKNDTHEEAKNPLAKSLKIDVQEQVNIVVAHKRVSLLDYGIAYI